MGIACYLIGFVPRAYPRKILT